MTTESDPPEPLTPTEGVVVSNIETAVENVLAELGLNPDQESYKYEKYTFLTAIKFPESEESPISYSWFRWGVSTLAGRGGTTTSETLHTDKAAAMEIIEAEIEDIEEFLKTGIPEFPIQEWWSEPKFDFLRGFYSEFAREEYKQLYLTNIGVLENLEFVSKSVHRGESLITETTLRRALTLANQLETEVASLEGVRSNYEAVSYFTELYCDTILHLVDINIEHTEVVQKTAIDQLHRVYDEILWPLLATKLSEASPEGPNPDKVVEWASGHNETLIKQFEESNIKEICDAAGVLREFKEYKSKSISDAGTRPLHTVLADNKREAQINKFIEAYGLKTLADVVDLIPDYTKGNVTYRGIANAVEIPYGEAFDIIDAMMPIINEEPESEQLRPSDIDEETREDILSGIDL